MPSAVQKDAKAVGSLPKLDTDSLATSKSRDRLAGHLNHLTPAQDQALQQFKTKLQKAALLKTMSRSTSALNVTAANPLVNGENKKSEGKSVKTNGHDEKGPKPNVDGSGEQKLMETEATYDDATLLRFLRARKFDPNAAFLQFSSTLEWRKSNNVAQLYDDFPVDEFSFTQQVYPQWTGRRDKVGLPVYVYKIGSLTKERIGDYNKDEARAQTRMIALYEHMMQFALPFCTSAPHPDQATPISATTSIIDISNVSLARFWALRSHMQRASTLATANYAETLGAIYVIGAPSFFSTVWGWIKNWFDPGTVEKIFIIPHSQVLAVLSKFIDVENIPKDFGGQLDWSYGKDRPNLGQEEKETLGLDFLPTGSLRWNVTTADKAHSAKDGSGKDRLLLKGKGRKETDGLVVDDAHRVREQKSDDATEQSLSKGVDVQHGNHDESKHEAEDETSSTESFRIAKAKAAEDAAHDDYPQELSGSTTPRSNPTPANISTEMGSKNASDQARLESAPASTLVATAALASANENDLSTLAHPSSASSNGKHTTSTSLSTAENNSAKDNERAHAGETPVNQSGEESAASEGVNTSLNEPAAPIKKLAEQLTGTAFN